MYKKLTITVEEEVYRGLYNNVGPRRISHFLNQLAKEKLAPMALDEAYKAMAKDEDREQEAQEWCEGLMPELD